nr:hypothetical protein Iba_chr05eCG6430 [Ipomoea batatas]
MPQTLSPCAYDDEFSPTPDAMPACPLQFLLYTAMLLWGRKGMKGRDHRMTAETESGTLAYPCQNSDSTQMRLS